MKQTPDDEGLTPIEASFTPLPPDLVQEIETLFDRGAEEYWMQDVRCAQRRINDERARLRAAQSSSSSETERGSLDDSGSK